MNSFQVPFWLSTVLLSLNFWRSPVSNAPEENQYGESIPHHRHSVLRVVS